MDILFLFIGLALGFIAAWLIFRSRNDGPARSAIEKSKIYEQQILELKQSLSDKERALIDLTAQFSARETELKNLNVRLQEQKAEMLEMGERFKTEFRNLANDILEDKSKKFTEQNKANLDQILKPLGEKIREFEKKVEETYDKETQQRVSLREEVRRLAELNQQISKEAQSLTKALKGDSKTQGNWGEVVLESILERTGLRKGIEYTVQNTFYDDDNQKMISDVIVHYPGERSIVIDSKVTLTDYERYITATDEVSRDEALKAHLGAVKKRINELATKNYQDIEEIKTLDFIILFMPVEPAYLIAIQNDPQLWSYAYEKRILLISPTNLVAVLKMIDSLWKQEYQNKNVLEIARQGGELFDKFVGFVDDLKDVGSRLQQAQKSYDDSLKKLSTGRGNLVKKAQDLQKLGLKTKKNLPEDLLNHALESGDNESED